MQDITSYQDLDEDELCLKVELGEGRGGTQRFANPGELFSGFWPLLLCASATAAEVLLSSFLLDHKVFRAL